MRGNGLEGITIFSTSTLTFYPNGLRFCHQPDFFGLLSFGFFSFWSLSLTALSLVVLLSLTGLGFALAVGLVSAFGFAAFTGLAFSTFGFLSVAGFLRAGVFVALLSSAPAFAAFFAAGLRLRVVFFSAGSCASGFVLSGFLRADFARVGFFDAFSSVGAFLAAGLSV